MQFISNNRKFIEIIGILDRHCHNGHTKLFLLSVSTSEQLTVATTKQASALSRSGIHRTRRDNNSKAFDVVVVRRHSMKGYQDQRRPAVGHITMIMVPELTWRACRNAPPSNYTAIGHPDICRQHRDPPDTKDNETTPTSLRRVSPVQADSEMEFVNVPQNSSKLSGSTQFS